MGRRFAIATVIALLLLAVGVLVQGAIESGLPTPTPAPKVIAARVAGNVEKLGSDGTWRSLAAGEELSLDDTLRTADGATAVLSLGEHALIELSPQSQMQVAEISRETSRLRLEDGRMQATVTTEDSKLRVTFKGSDAVAESGAGEFSALTVGDGTVAVAARKGDVTLTAKEKTVTVAAGQQSIVRPDLPPASPIVIEPALFLKVGKPSSLIQREKETVVTGEASPGAIVEVNGVRAVVGTDGRFSTRVELREGKNSLVVRAVTASGAKESETLPAITVDSKPLDVTGKVEWK